MKRTLFTHVRVFDGSGAAPFAADVLIEDERIAAIHRSDESPSSPSAGASVIDGRGATLMPGLIEAHAHLSWPSSVERFVPGMSLPPDDLVLNTARNARILIDHGFTSAYSGGALAESVEIALKACIESGGIPGPRLVPSSIEREPPSETALVQTGQMEEHGTGPNAVRAFVKHCADIGAKSVKFLLSGESALKPGASMQLMYTEEELQAAGEQARASNVWLTGHAHAAEAIKMGLRNGFRVLYHCTYADAEAIDMLEARKAEVFVAPTIGIVQATLDAKPPPHFDMTHMKADAQTVLERQRVLVPELKKRGVRLLPGGDYGFPFNPNGRNARDLELFVRHFGYTATEALIAATRLGGQIMGMESELGQIKVGYLADLLLVDGDPTRDVAVLQDKNRLLAIMKAGRFHKAPAGLQ
jgi:imidazolonepropionase-like amidohydrolase